MNFILLVFTKFIIIASVVYSILLRGLAYIEAS
jgi:hypothetical protein